MRVLLLLAVLAVVGVKSQRITTIQLDGVQYFVSRMNPYSPELNYFLAYQYCRSLGLQLASFESREKADSITQYLSNAGYTKYDFWTSGNRLGTDMFLWMSTGLSFNATFNYMKRPQAGATGSAGSPLDPNTAIDAPSGSTAPQRTARDNGDSGSTNGCVALRAPTLEWDTADCTEVKDFICEQTRCYYYNYGSIPVSSAQGKPISLTTTTTTTTPPAIETTTTTLEPTDPEEQKVIEEKEKATQDKETNEDTATRFSLTDLINTLRPSLTMQKHAAILSVQKDDVQKVDNDPQIDSHYSGINVLNSNNEDSEDDKIHAGNPEGDELTTINPMSLHDDINVNDTPTELLENDNGLKDKISATAGPYDDIDIEFRPQGDDPNVHREIPSNEKAYVSTIEPEVMTTYKYMQSARSNAKVLDSSTK